jgi:phage terminase large subunit
MTDNSFIYTSALDKIRKMKARIKIIPGGSSAGKTYSILPILMDMAIRTKGLSISVVSESMPHLRRGAMRDFIKIMKSTNRYIDKNWNRSNFIYTFSNGSFIEFFSVDEEAKLRGARRHVLYINECNNVSEESYMQLAMRTSGDIFLDYNPSNRFWVNNIDVNDSERLVLTYKDNEALPQTVIDFLESKLILAQTSTYWKNWCNVYLYGKEGSLEGVVFNNWEEIDIVPTDAELVGYGMDFGFTNDPSTCVGVYRWNGKLVCDQVIYAKGLSNSDLSKLMLDGKVAGEVYADSAEPKSIDELKKYGHKVYSTKKGPDSILHGINLLQEYELLITRRSIDLKEELRRYSWKKDKDGNTMNVPEGIWDHCIDAVRYLALMKLGRRSLTAGTFVQGKPVLNRRNRF